MEVTKEEFLAFVGGRADEEVRRRIAAALEVRRSNVCRWLRQIDAVAEHPFDVNWLSLGGHAIDHDAEPKKASAQTASESTSPVCETEATETGRSKDRAGNREEIQAGPTPPLRTTGMGKR